MSEQENKGLIVETSAKTPQPRKPRQRKAKVEVKPEIPPATTNTPPTTSDDGIEEVVVLDDASKGSDEPVLADEDIIADEVSGITSGDGFKLTGTKDYKIDPNSLTVARKDGDVTGQYPFYVWMRDPTTLAGYFANSVSRIEADQGTEHDYRLHAIATDNRIVWDTDANSFFSRTNADWRNHLEFNGRKLRHGKVGIKSSGDRELSSVRQETLLFDKLGLGVPLIVRMWHSGPSFTINPLTKEECVNITTRLRNAHLETLRKTTGLIHGVSTFYANRIIVEEFMSRVTGSNIDKSLYGKIMTLIDHRDIQSMAWGLFASLHPKGFRLVEQCGGTKEALDANNKPILKDDGSIRKTPCTHRDEIIGDPNLIYTIDNAMLNEWQREVLSRPISGSATITEEDIIKFRSQGPAHVEDSICVDEESQIFVTIKPPVINAHIEIGEEWINSIEDSLNAIMTFDTTDESKDEFVNNRIQAATSLDVVHWVTGFIIDGVELRDREALIKTFRGLSNRPVMQNNIFDVVRKGIISRTACMYAIPTTKCPECKTLSSTVFTNGTAIYTPIDMVARFFTQIARNQ